VCSDSIIKNIASKKKKKKRDGLRKKWLSQTNQGYIVQQQKNLYLPSSSTFGANLFLTTGTLDLGLHRVGLLNPRRNRNSHNENA
jgi:hypothetical protein